MYDIIRNISVKIPSIRTAIAPSEVFFDNAKYVVTFRGGNYFLFRKVFGFKVPTCVWTNSYGIDYLIRIIDR